MYPRSITDSYFLISLLVLEDIWFPSFYWYIGKTAFLNFLTCLSPMWGVCMHITPSINCQFILGPLFYWFPFFYFLIFQGPLYILNTDLDLLNMTIICSASVSFGWFFFLSNLLLKKRIHFIYLFIWERERRGISADCFGGAELNLKKFYKALLTLYSRTS